MTKRMFTLMVAVLISTAALFGLICLLEAASPDLPGSALAAPLNPDATVTEVDPSSAPNDLDAPIVIAGTEFLSTPTVHLGDTSLNDVSWVSSTTLQAVVPWGMDPGVYTLTVTNPDLGLPSDVLTEAFTVTNELDHFVFAPVLTQTAGMPITITLTALDAFGWPVPDYGGTVTLTDSTGTISPTVSPAFVNGQASFAVTITAADASAGDVATSDRRRSDSGQCSARPLAMTAVVS